MTDETPQPNQPIDAEIVPKTHLMVSKLSTLPPEIIEEMDTRLMGKESVKFVREDMIQKYPTLEALKASYLTWMKRARKLNGGSQKEIKEGVVAKKEMVAALPSSEQLKEAVSKVLDPQISLDKKQEALSSLFDKATQRLAILEASQQHFMDPNFEALILAYMKEQKSLIEKVTELQEVLQRDTLSQFRSELDELIRVILTTVYAAYKLNHADIDPTSKFDGFKADLESHLSKTLQNYKQQNQPKN
jgi:hypothetical protein